MTESGPRIQAVATAVPQFAVEQSEAKAFAAAFFQPGFKNLSRLLQIFDNTLIEKRHISQAPEWYAQPHTFPETNKLYEEIALQLTAQAARQALAQAEVQPAQVGMVIFVSTTGLATPSIDAKLIQALGLPAHTARLPIWGLGCAGGVAGLARAAELARALPGQAILLIAVELCSLTFQHNDHSKSNLVATSLFGDGAAAAVLRSSGNGPEIIGNYSHLFADSEDVMGWDVVETGLKVRFSRSIPALVQQTMPQLLSRACAAWRIAAHEIRHYVVHPGGPKVLDAYAESLELTPERFKHALEILKYYGNMSSVTVLFVLERFLQATQPTGEYGLMMALGPGFSAEQLLFRW